MHIGGSGGMMVLHVGVPLRPLGDGDVGKRGEGDADGDMMYRGGRGWCK